jgi:putative transposase
MPRQPRFFVPHIPQHVVQRGVDRQAVFFQPDDYHRYLHSLGKAADKYDCKIHAYVLMTNHTHLLVTPGSKRSIPLIMQAMGRGYVQMLNKKYNRTGTLWEGRYKASLVQDERYLLACHKYIELNPVRAGLVAKPGDYPHSSFAHNARGESNGLLTPHSIYQSLASTAERRRLAYRSLFHDSVAPELLSTIRATTNACLVLGDERFKDQIEAMLGRSVRPGKNGRPPKADR